MARYPGQGDQGWHSPGEPQSVVVSLDDYRRRRKQVGDIKHDRLPDDRLHETEDHDSPFEGRNQD